MKDQDDQTANNVLRGALPGSSRFRELFRDLAFRRIISNTGWLVFDKILRGGIGLLVGVWIARYLGPGQFGSLNYAISLSAIFGSIAGLGLDSIVVREIVSNPGTKDTILGTSLVLRALGGCLTILACFVVTYAASLADVGTRVMVMIIALSYVFQAFDVVDFWFQANVQSKYSVITRSIVFFCLSTLRVFFILAGGTVVVFAILATVEILFGSFGLILAYQARGSDIRTWRYDHHVAVNLLRDSWPLMLSGLAIVIYLKVDQVLLGTMMNMQAVGIYSAAVRIVEVWYFIPGTITVSVFPSIVEAKRTNPVQYMQWMQILYDVMAGLSILIAVVVSVFSQKIIVLMYGSGYLEAAPILTLYVWSGVATFLGIASSQYLMAENLTKYSMYRTLVGMILNLVLNLLLIPRYGITGSAVSTLISYFAATFMLALYPSTRAQAGMMMKSLVVTRALRLFR